MTECGVIIRPIRALQSPGQEIGNRIGPNRPDGRRSAAER